MKTGHELLAAVNAAPEDDAPRLAYAAYVEGSEPEYAEFIRLQIARTAAERARKAPYSSIVGREQMLRHRHYAQWGHYIERYARDAREPHAYNRGWEFERGFIAFIRMEPENFVALGQRLFDMAPIEHLDLIRGTEPVGPLWGSPFLSRLDSLSFSMSQLDDDDAVAIANCEALSRATWLDLSRNRIGERGVRALAESPFMDNKIVLDLRGNPGNPGEEASYDWDGSIADSGFPPIAWRIADALGRMPQWFRTVFRDPMPDRYHAKWSGFPKR